jgi:Mce-associated membrane protein
MNPTLYDVLGVSRDASREEIRKAWRDAADRFEPGEGGSTKQFRLFNEAAEVLLDPERRKSYDAQLEVGATSEREAAPAADEEPVPESTVPAPAVPGAARAMTSTTATPVAVPPTDAGAETGRRLPWWVLALLGVLTAVAVGLAAFFVTQAQQDRGYLDALDRAPGAAESAAAAVLSYDHETLEADRDAAAKFLTEGYRSDYVETFDKLVMDSATETRASVEAEVLASSAMLGGSERDPDRVPVLLFVNQTSTNAAGSGEPSVALNRVRFDMVHVDGAWLVDGITSY